MLPEMRIISKTASNKSYLGFNFIQKSQWVHMSSPPRVGLGGILDCQFQYTIIFQRWQSLQLPSSTSVKDRHICAH